MEKARVRSTGNAHRVQNDVRKPCPEINRAGDDGVFGRVALRVKDEHQWRENNEIFNRIGVREVKPLRPG
jgi:hypothetical protein